MTLLRHDQNRQNYFHSKLLPQFLHYPLTTILRFYDETPSPLYTMTLTSSQFPKTLMEGSYTISNRVVHLVLRHYITHTSLLSDITLTHTELLHIHYTFIITHNWDGADMLTSRLQMLPNTFSHSLTSYNFNCREIGEWSLSRTLRISHISNITSLRFPPNHHRTTTYTLSFHTHT